MPSCTIIISHFESLHFLRACVRQIKKFAHHEIPQHILIIDQSGDKTHYGVMYEYCDDPEVRVMRSKPHYSGYGIDWAMRYGNIHTDYVCQLHVDAFPIHHNWLYLPIKLIEENNFSFVGQTQFYTKPGDSIYYLNKMFFCMAQCFNVARTETYKEMSLIAGFTRFHEREKDKQMFFVNDDWARWAQSDYHARGTDDDVVAFCWEDNHRQHNKLGLSVTGMIEKQYGRTIEDLVFHFGSCRESIGVFGSMPQQYQDYTKRIKENYSDELIDELLSKVVRKDFPRDVWDGVLKERFEADEELTKKIEQLKIMEYGME